MILLAVFNKSSDTFPASIYYCSSFTDLGESIEVDIEGTKISITDYAYYAPVHLKSAEVETKAVNMLKTNYLQLNDFSGH